MYNTQKNLDFPQTERERRSTLRAINMSDQALRVFALIAEGQASQEVADALFISKRTVDFHLARTFKKLNVTNRMMAVRALTGLGLLPYVPHEISDRRY